MRVFLVHGRDHQTRDALEALLRALYLKVVSWRQASTWAGGGSPYTGDIVKAGMDGADAVVVLLTPDDLGHVRPDLLEPRDGPDEREPTGQPRMNVLFEAGMAMGIDRSRVVLVEVGAVRRMSDIDGVNVVRLDDSVEKRKDFIARLRAAGLTVDMEDDAWRTAGTFAKPAVSAARPQASRGAVSGKQQAYAEFWKFFLDRIGQRRDAAWVRARTNAVRTDNYVVLWSRRGEAYVVSFSGDGRLRCEYYIDKGDAAASMRRFDALRERREAIEKRVGVDLSWEDLPGRRSCRVAAYRPGEVNDKDRHADYADWFVATAITLREAIEMEGSDG